MSKGLIFVISGPSGVGKGTVIAEVMKQLDNVCFSVSDTTRKPRPGEVDGVNYCYISREQFEDNIKNGKVVEYTYYNGNYYGTPRSAVDKCVAEGKTVILDVEVEGAANIRRVYPECTLLFILPPSIEELQKRLEGRKTETAQQIEGRMARSREELKLAPGYDYRVVNNDVDICAAEIVEIIKKERQK